MYNNSKKKIRGQRRKMNNLIRRINNFNIEYPYPYTYDHFHVPCANDFIDAPKVCAYVKKSFCQAWIDKTQLFIQQKPKDAEFFKIVCVIDKNHLWNSQIVIFYDKIYYIKFWNRNDEYQSWIPLENRSYKQEIALKTDMMEVGFKEIIVDEDVNYTTELWFYGELDILTFNE